MKWTPEEIDGLRAIYAEAGTDGVVKLSEYAERIGRLKSNVCRKARELGLPTSATRKTVEQRKRRRKYDTDEARKAAQSERIKRVLRENGHPRGMAGKKHSEATKAAIGEMSKAAWAALGEDGKQEKLDAMLKASRAANNGAPRITRGTWKAGWREIGGKRNYYRSRWEANYARYLEWLKARGEIQEWAHEPETFWFEAIKRGVRSYKPDFRVWENDGSSRLHEVKGWMDSRSRTTLARMKKYHPQETIVLIDGPQYRAIRSKMMGLIEGWEDSARDSHA